MNILLLGGGGREHAMADKIASSPHCDRLYIAPGNAGTSLLGHNINLNPEDFVKVKSFVGEAGIGMVIVGPEAPLVNGIVDFFAADETLQSIPIIGPSKAGAMLEGSKDFAKGFMQRHNIPTAHYKTFTSANQARAIEYVRQHHLPVVLKADGLAAGKGVVICTSHAEAEKELIEFFSGKFGEASARVVIEQFLDGIEFSVFVLTDGKNYILLPEAKDYKRIGEGDTGPNTGGMGAVSPVPFVDDVLWQKVISGIVEPTVNGIALENIHYKGFIFFGLIRVGQEPYVIEYNCRMGDPETEVVLPRLQTDLVECLLATWQGTLQNIKPVFDQRTAVTIMLVSGGYPGDYEKGKVISGLDRVDGSRLYHAGTAQRDGQIVTSGGRVLAITSMASEMQRALDKSMRNAIVVDYEGKYFRSDIGKDLQKE